MNVSPSKDLRLTVEIVPPAPDQEEAWRRQQLPGLRRFLAAVQENRRLSPSVMLSDAETWDQARLVGIERDAEGS